MRVMISFLVFAILNITITGCSQKEDISLQRKTIIVYGLPADLNRLKTHQELIALFEKEHPEINVKIEHSSWGAFWNKMNTQLAGGTAPDVWLTDNVYFATYAKRDVLLELQSYIERDISLNNYFRQAVNTFKYKGRLHGMPTELQVIALYYNKDLFDRYGVKYPDENWTWDSFKEAAIKLTVDIDGNGKIDYFGFISTPWLPVYINFIRQNGGMLISRDKTKCLLNQPEAIEAIQFLLDLVYKYKVGPTIAETESTGATRLFTTGKIAMDMIGYWMVNNYRKEVKFNWDVAPLPYKKLRANNFNGVGHVININTKYPEQAWQFVKFLSSRTSQTILAQSGLGIPVLKEVADSEIYLDSTTVPEHKKVFVECLEYAEDLDITEDWNEWRVALSEELQLAWLRKVSVEDACKAGMRRVNKILGEE